MASEPCIPKLANMLFRWYCKPDRYEEMHGDLEEFFYDRLERDGLLKARLFYWYNVLRCCQPYAWRSPKTWRTTAPLLRNYYKTSIRNMLRNPLSTFINLSGLSVAIAVALLAYSFWQYVYTKDAFHAHKGEVYLTSFTTHRDGSPQEYGFAPAPIGDLIEEKTPFTTCRIQKTQGIVKHKQWVFYEELHFVDPTFHDFFTFPLKWGAPLSLADSNGIVLTERVSEKYFGDRYSVGEELSLRFGDRWEAFTVVGVVEDPPSASSFSFNFLINYSALRFVEPSFDSEGWQQFITATFVRLPTKEDVSTVIQTLENYRLQQNLATPGWAISQFGLEPLATMYLSSSTLQIPLVNDGSRENQISIYFLGTLALVMLLLACFNYLNMAIATVGRRLKEIGVRKAIGANRARVMVQFLVENYLLCLLAIGLGVVLALTITIPGFERLHSFRMDFQLWDPELGIFLFLLLLGTGSTSGIYPALFIADFQVVRIFRSKVKLTQGTWVTNGLLGFQIVLGCLAITCAVFFKLNAAQMHQRPWGYSPEGVLYVQVPDAESFRELADVFEKKAYVQSLSGTHHHLSKEYETAVLQLPDGPLETDLMYIDANYAHTMKLILAQGRWFHSETETEGVVINQLLANSLDGSDLIGETITVNADQLQILGVVENFHSNDFSVPINPLAMRLGNPTDIQYFSISVSPQDVALAYKELQTQWKSTFPNTPFAGGLQMDSWGPYFSEIGTHSLFWQVIAILAIVLASLGLYGLISVHVTGRIQEFSIRKVLGAGPQNIAWNIFQKYLLLYSISLSIGLPISFLLVRFIFQLAYPYHMPVIAIGTLPADILLLFVLLGVVIYQVMKVGRLSPAHGLRLE